MTRLILVQHKSICNMWNNVELNETIYNMKYGDTITVL